MENLFHSAADETSCGEKTVRRSTGPARKLLATSICFTLTFGINLNASAIPLILPAIVDTIQSAGAELDSYVQFSDELSKYAEALGIPYPTPVETKILHKLQELSEQLDRIEGKLDDLKTQLNRIEHLIIENSQKDVFVEVQAFNNRLMRDAAFYQDQNGGLRPDEVLRLFSPHVQEFDRLVAKTGSLLDVQNDEIGLHAPNVLVSLSASMLTLLKVSKDLQDQHLVSAYVGQSWKQTIVDSADLILRDESPIVLERNRTVNEYQSKLNRIGNKYGIENFFADIENGRSTVCLESRFAHETSNKTYKKDHSCFGYTWFSSRKDRETGKIYRGNRPSFCVQFRQEEVTFELEALNLSTTKLLTAMSEQPAETKSSVSAKPQSSCTVKFENRSPADAYSMFSKNLNEDLKLSATGSEIGGAEVLDSMLRVTENVRKTMMSLSFDPS